MGALEAQAEPLTVSVRDGEVVMTGKRVAIALTGVAAQETADRLAAAARQLSGDEGQGSQTPTSDS
jgi:predicted RecA/RadA family phage recombinase